MGVDWPVIQLGQATTSVTKGTTPRQGEVDTSALEANFLRAETISEDGRLLHEKFQRIDFLTYERYARSRLHENDVLFTIAGAIGRVGIADASILPANINQAIALIRVDSAMLDYRFLSYVLRSDVVQRHATSRVVQSVQANFSLGELKTLEIPLPPLREQQAIADVLGALDDKIELNRKMNETLDELARTIFRSWFVDFDPVRAKMEGGEPFGMDAETAALFPDRLVDSPMGPIPEGWEVDSFTTLANIVGGGTPKTKIEDYWDGEIPWFAMADLPNNGSPYVIDTEKKITVAGEANSSAKRIPENSTILTARGTVGETVIAGVEMAFNQSCYALRPASECIGPYTLFLLTRSQVDVMRSRAHGSVFSTITRSTLDSLQIAVPDRRVFNALENTVSPFFKMMLANSFESQTLADLRDTLLPELISGRIRVPEAARVVGEAV